MSGRATILGHLVSWGLRGRYEDAATEGLAYLLQRYPRVRERFVARLRAVQPGLPGELHFSTQARFAELRPDMCGWFADSPRVFVENKFWAALTPSQPTAYLRELGRQGTASLVLFLAPRHRVEWLWRELVDRMRDFSLPYGMCTERVLEAAGELACTRLHLVSWDELFAVLRADAEGEVLADIEQLAGVCSVADEEEARPLTGEDLTDPRIPSRLIQYVNIVRGVIDRASADIISLDGLRGGFEWYALGHKFQFTGENAPGAWLGIDLLRWRRSGIGPIWLHFDWNRGQARKVRARLLGRTMVDIDDGLMVHLELLVGSGQEAVIQHIVAQLRGIAERLREPPPPSVGGA